MILFPFSCFLSLVERSKLSNINKKYKNSKLKSERNREFTYKKFCNSTMAINWEKVGGGKGSFQILTLMFKIRVESILLFYWFFQWIYQKRNFPMRIPPKRHFQNIAREWSSEQLPSLQLTRLNWTTYLPFYWLEISHSMANQKKLYFLLFWLVWNFAQKKNLEKSGFNDSLSYMQLRNIVIGLENIPLNRCKPIKLKHTFYH